MNKNLSFYVAICLLLMLVLVFFNSSYKALKADTSLINTHHAVHSGFQKLSKQINNAAVLNPDLMVENVPPQNYQLFLTDRREVMGQVTYLKTIVRDSINMQIMDQLDPLIASEISWLLGSNVPDSMVHQKAVPHLRSLLTIDSLISKGIDRTNFLISYRQSRTIQQMKTGRLLIFVFVILSGILLIYTTFVLFRQQSKRKSKERELAMVLNRISDGVVSVDNQWRYTFLNDAAMATHPSEREQLLGKSIWDIHPEMHGTVFWEKYHEAMQSRKVQEIESYYPPMDTWFSVKVYPSEDGLTIFYKDVTAGKKAEERLSRTLKEVEDYKFALDEASIVAITDQKGIIRHANANFCRISKYSLEELVGKDHRIINSGYHPKEFIRDLWVTIANGKIWKGEMRNRAKDGSIYWVDTTIVPFLNEQGKPYQYIAIRADITSRKAAEERLMRSERIYKTIASGIPGSVICLLDKDLKYFLIEGDMLENLGYSKDDLLGNRAQDVLPADVFKEVKRDFDHVLSGRSVVREANRMGYDVISRFIPLKDEHNEVYAIMTVTNDVTRLKDAQRNITELNRNLEKKIAVRTEELRKSNEELESFSYSVSHDLRAPLRGIIGFSAVLEEEYGKQLDAEANRVIGIIKDSAARMGQLIDDLLAFSRTGKQSLQKTTVNTAGMVNEVVQEMLKLAENRQDINLTIEDLPLLYGDQNTIRLVWTNLLSNAVKYSRTRDHPLIHVGSFTKDDEQIFFVRDNGVGFDEKYKHKLFRVFQRLHDSAEFEGTGVGLALVERIISKHQGRIWAEGKPGEGACFYFTLPVKKNYDES